MSADPGKDLLGRKTQYYVEYLGWRAARGLEGREFTEPIIQELLRRRHGGPLPKLTIQVSRKEVKVSREVAEDGKKKKIKTIKYPSIPSRDVTFAIQALEPDTDIVACVYLGFNPKTSSYVHVHVYRCDSPQTALTFVMHLHQIINVPENRKRLDKIERDLLSRNAIDPPSNFGPPKSPKMREYPARNPQHPMRSSGTSTGSNERSPPGSDDLDADMVSLKDVMPFDGIADELKHRLNIKAAPILLPPVDYDTVSRVRGNLDEAYKRKSRNPIIVGEMGASTANEETPKTENQNVFDGDDRIPNADQQFPNEAFYLYPPRSPRDEPSERVKTKHNVARNYEGPSSPRVPRIVPNHGRQLSNSSSHSHQSNGSGPNAASGVYDSRDRLSGYSNGSNSYRDISSVHDEPQADYSSNFAEDLSLRPKDNYRRGMNLNNSTPPELLRVEMDRVEYRDHEDLVMRNNEHFNRSEQLTKSMPLEGFRRELLPTNERDYAPRSSGHSGYDDRHSPRYTPSPQPGDFGLRKVHSMYR